MNAPLASRHRRASGPLLTLEVQTRLLDAARTGRAAVECSLDLGRSQTTVHPEETYWRWDAGRYPYVESCKGRTIYYWCDGAFQPVARYSTSLIKLVPTPWGPPTFEIDGIKMLPTAQVSPFDDAQRKVALVQPRDKVILDTCGGLGYFAGWCLRGNARRVDSFERDPDVRWLRELNPWSPEGAAEADDRLRLELADVTARIGELGTATYDAVLHDPPRFAIAGELYSQAFYDELSRVLKRRGRLFHYTGAPNKLSGRDLAQEVTRRLRKAGFAPEPALDGVLAVKGRG